MAVSTFFTRLWQQAKAALAQHPLEILLVTVFSLSTWFLDFSDRSQMRFAYWLFAPLYFIVTYLLRNHKKAYWASALLPLIGSLILWQTNDYKYFYLSNPKYWATMMIGFIMLCATPWQKLNQPFTYRTFTTSFNAGLAYLVGWLAIGLLFSIRYSLKILFNVEFSDEFDLHLSVFGQYFFPPLLFLIFQQRYNKELTLNRLLEIVLSFILSPALIIYTLILYAYVVRILGLGELPKGMVSNLALPYLALGLAVYCLQVLCVKPRWQFFFHYYPYLAIVPIVLLWFAIARRIEAYSWTEGRIYLVALTVALSLCYFCLILPALRQYRYLAGIVVLTIFSMTFVINPKQIAYVNQTQRFEMLLTKLNLVDTQGKIRADFDPKTELSKVTDEQFVDYRNLDSIANYLVHHTEPEDKSKYDWNKRNEQLKKKYGDSFDKIWVDLRFSEYESKKIYYKEELIFDSSPEVRLVNSFNYGRNYDSAFNLQGYRRLIRLPSFSLESKNQDDNPYTSEQSCVNFKQESAVCFDLDRLIRQVFEKNNLDIATKHSEETLKVLKEQILTFELPETNMVLLFDSLWLRYNKHVGYIFSYANDLTVLEK